MHHGLANAEIHQPYAHTGGKQHRQPGGKAELRAGIIGAEANMAIITDGQHQQQDQEQADCQHIEPAEVLGDPALSRPEETGGGLGASEQVSSNRPISSKLGIRMGRDRVQRGTGERCCVVTMASSCDDAFKMQKRDS